MSRGREVESTDRPPSSERPGPLAGLTRVQRRLALAVVLGTTANAFEAISVVGAMPAITDDLDGRGLYGATFTTYMLFNLVALIVTGEVADRRGPHLPFAAGVVLFVAGLTVSGVAPTMEVLVLGRAFQGLGAGALYGTGYVVVARAFGPEHRSAMFALLSTAWVVPGIAGPLLAGGLTDTVGWRWVFLGLLPAPVVAGALGLGPMRRLGAPEVPRHGPSQAGAAVVLAVGLGALVTGLQQGRWWLLAVLVVAGAAVAWQGLERLFPPRWWALAPGAGTFVAVRLVTLWAFFGTDTFIPLAVTEGHGTSNTVGAVTIMGATVSWTAGSWCQERLTVRWGARSVVTVGMGLLVVAIVLSAPVSWASYPYLLAFPSWALAGLGIGLIFNLASVEALRGVDEARSGKVSSQLQVADSMGGALGIGVGGALVAAGERGGWDLTPTLLGVFALAFTVGLVGLAMARRVRSARQDGPGHQIGAEAGEDGQVEQTGGGHHG